ncbi:MAG: hypothetical protein NBV68_11045 [Erythrobacter sp.]|uniref:hypothetical protein n=1 Tax=Erythrobacter sp. TaxID=1042 RepID=UPI0025F80BB7|nr:hypothetical protein [Erythrobacter sp.]MCL9999908.1 hypothetical protein [Erythrobacter sp.]
MVGKMFDWVRSGSRDKAETPPMAYAAEARLYAFRDRIFVCSVRWIAETESLTVLDAACDDASLGSSILHHLAEFSDQPMDLSGYKLTDWPAYRASGAKSVKAFERELWHVYLSIMNSAVLVRASPRLTNADHELGIYASANLALPEQVGAATRSAIAAVKRLRDVGGI